MVVYHVAFGPHVLLGFLKQFGYDSTYLADFVSTYCISYSRVPSAVVLSIIAAYVIPRGVSAALSCATVYQLLVTLTHRRVCVPVSRSVLLLLNWRHYGLLSCDMVCMYLV